MSKKTKKSRVNLYGGINSWNDNAAAVFIRRLEEAGANSEVIELHIHSPGGDVFEGNMIYNAIAQSKTPVDVYVDGVAASMASIVMLSARKIYMASNAFVMIHSPSTFTGGTADELEKSAKLLRSLEGIFIEAYAKRTGQDSESVKEWLNGDNWFTAQEALDEKLIDGIVDASDIEILISESEVKEKNATALFRQFEAVAKIKSSNHKNEKKEMDKESLIKKFDLQGVTAVSTDSEIEAAIAAKISAGDQKAKQLEKKQISSIISSAIDAKKITEKDRPDYESIAEKAGVDVLESILAKIIPAQSITSQLGNSQSAGSQSKADWSWDKWQDEDPRGLEALQKSDPDQFSALLKKKYNK